jgi:DNA-binding NtrC family response regulator
MMTDSDVIDVRDLPDRIQNHKSAANKEAEEVLSMEQAARQNAQRVLAHTGGNKVRAAEILGISRTHLCELLKKTAAEQDQANSDLNDQESNVSTTKV